MRFITVAVACGAVALSQQGCKSTTTTTTTVTPSNNKVATAPVLNTAEKQKAEEEEKKKATVIAEATKKAEEKKAEEKKAAAAVEDAKKAAVEEVTQKAAIKAHKKQHKKVMAELVKEQPKMMTELSKKKNTPNVEPKVFKRAQAAGVEAAKVVREAAEKAAAIEAKTPELEAEILELEKTLEELYGMNPQFPAAQKALAKEKEKVETRMQEIQDQLYPKKAALRKEIDSLIGKERRLENKRDALQPALDEVAFSRRGDDEEIVAARAFRSLELFGEVDQIEKALARNGARIDRAIKDYEADFISRSE